MRSLLAGGRMAALVALILAPGFAAAQEATAGPLLIQHPWVRATPGGAQVAGGYVTIVNTGTRPDSLVGGSIEAASRFELHRMSMDGDVMRMRPTGPLEIPAGGRLTLDPMGMHIMFTGLKRRLAAGEAVGGTLVFEQAGTVAVRFAVEAPGAKAPTGPAR